MYGYFFDNFFKYLNIILNINWYLVVEKFIKIDIGGKLLWFIIILELRLV